MKWLLYIPGKVVFLTVPFLFGIPYSLRYIHLKSFWVTLGDKIYRTTLLYDHFAGVWSSELLNDVLVQKDGHAYGHQDDTISDITGRNERDGMLTPFGVKFTRFLDILGKNHSLESIEEHTLLVLVCLYHSIIGLS